MAITKWEAAGKSLTQKTHCKYKYQFCVINFGSIDLEFGPVKSGFFVYTIYHHEV